MASGPRRISQSLIDVLCALLAADHQGLPGWAIMNGTQRSGPAVYRTLERLTAAQWVSWRWEERATEDTGPRRRLYRLTPDGARSARRTLIRYGIPAARQPLVTSGGRNR